MPHEEEAAVAKEEQSAKTPPAPKTPKTELQLLTERLEAAERRGRRARRVGLLAFGASALALAAASGALLAPYSGFVRVQLDRLFRRGNVVLARKTVVEAEQFVVRGSDGEVRGELALRDDGSLALSLYDREGRARATLAAEADGGAGLSLAGHEGQPGLSLTARNLRFTDREGGAFLTSTGLGLTSWDVQDARSGIWLGARPDGTSALTLADSRGKTRVGIGLRADGAPNFTLYDKEGRNGVVLDVPVDGARLGLFSEGVARAGLGHGAGGSQISLYGTDGKDRVTLRSLADGSAGLFLHEQDGTERVAMGVRPGGTAGLSLFDRKTTLRAGLTVVSGEAPHLMLFDAGGVRRANFGLFGDGLPGLQFEDKGRMRAVLGAAGEDKGRQTTAPASLVLYDSDGSILFQAPIL